jgi:hypothetical protein
MKHLKETGFTYFGHLFYSWSLIGRCIKVIIKLSIHSIFPFWFEDTGWKNLGK